MFKNLQNIARFAQLQFKRRNMCPFLIQFPILVKINAVIIEILTLKTGTGLQKFTISRNARPT